MNSHLAWNHIFFYIWMLFYIFSIPVWKLERVCKATICICIQIEALLCTNIWSYQYRIYWLNQTASIENTTNKYDNNQIQPYTPATRNTAPEQTYIMMHLCRRYLHNSINNMIISNNITASRDPSSQSIIPLMQALPKLLAFLSCSYFTIWFDLHGKILKHHSLAKSSILFGSRHLIIGWRKWVRGCT